MRTREYTVGLGRMYSDRTLSGKTQRSPYVDRHHRCAESRHERMWHFCITNIEIIDASLLPGSEVKFVAPFSVTSDEEAKTAHFGYFMNRYREFLKPDGLIHLERGNRLCSLHSLYGGGESITLSNGSWPDLTLGLWRTISRASALIMNNNGCGPWFGHQIYEVPFAAGRRLREPDDWK